MNPGLTGKVYPSATFSLDPGRVAAFATAVGHRVLGVPPTMVTAPELEAGLARAVGDPALGLHLAHVVHSEQEYRWERPLSEGETITAEATIEDVRFKGGLGFLVLRTEFRDGSGAVVAVGRTTLIERASR